MLRRFVIVGLAAALTGPAFAITPASAVVLFSCNRFSGGADISPGLGHTPRGQKFFPSVRFDECSNGETGTIDLLVLDTYQPRPLGCPEELGGPETNNYPSGTAILLATSPRTMEWDGSDTSVVLLKMKAWSSGVQWKIVALIQSGKYVASAGRKTKIRGNLNVAPYDISNFSCGDDSNPIEAVTFSLPAGQGLIANQK